MQRIIYLLLSVVLMLVLASCGNVDIATQSEPADTTEVIAPESTKDEDEVLSDKKEKSEKSKEQKILVAYFSWADNTEQDNIDATTSASVTVPGNVEQLAAWIATETDGDSFLY